MAEEELSPTIVPKNTDKDDEAKKEEISKLEMGTMTKVFACADCCDFFCFAVGMIGALGAGLCNNIVCLLFGDLFEGVGGTGNLMDQTKQLVLDMSYVGFATAGAAFLQAWGLRSFKDNIVKKIRVEYFDAVIHQDMKWHDLEDPAGLPTKMSQNVDLIAEAVGDKLGNAVMAGSAVVTGYVICFIQGWHLALALTPTLPFAFVGSMYMGRAIQDSQSGSQHHFRKASGMVEECLYSLRTVIAFGGEKRMIAEFTDAVELVRKAGIGYNLKLGGGLGYMMAVSYWTYVVAFYAGMLLVYNDVERVDGEVWSAGKIMGIFFVIFTAGFMAGQLEPGYTAWQKARVASKVLFDVIEVEPDVQRRKTVDDRIKVDMIERIEFAKVTFRYPTRPDAVVLNGLSLTIERGQNVALVGESGCGKSTVVSLLERFYDPESGEILINSQNIKTVNIAVMRSLIGYVGQEPVLFAGSVRENILRGAPKTSGEQLNAVLKQAQVDFLEELPDKIDTYVGSGGNQFSGGQKQRIAIARALMRSPSMLLLDEATSALDSRSERMIQKTLDDLSSTLAGKITMLSIAHRLSTIFRCDCIFVLKRGSVVELGTHQELVKMGGEYYALAATQESALNFANSADSNDVVIEEDKNNKGDASEKRVSVKDKPNTMAEKEAEEEARLEEVKKKYKVPMARLFGFCKPEWKYFAPGFFGACLAGVSMPLMALLLVDAMEGFMGPDKEKMKDTLIDMCRWIALLGVGVWIGYLMMHFFMGLCGEAMTKRIRIAIITKILQQEVGFFDDPEHAPGQLAKALQMWAFHVQALCTAGVSQGGSMVSLLFGTAMAFVACWQMALIMFAAIPILVVSSVVQMIVMFGGAGGGKELKASQQLVSDCMQSPKTVQAMCAEDNTVELYRELVFGTQTRAARLMRFTVAAALYGVSMSVQIFIIVVAMWFSTYLIEQGDADFGGTMKAMMGLFYAGLGAGMVASTAGDAARAKVAAHDMFKLLDRESKIDGLSDEIGEKPENLNAGYIEMSNVCFNYPFRPEIRVLSGVSFKVTAGMHVGLVGPSGGGKSTVMCLLQRFYDPLEGDVLIGAERMKLVDVNIRWWRRQIGFVGQEPVLFNSTVRANVIYGLPDGVQISEEKLEECKKSANLGFIDRSSGGQPGQGWATEVGPRGARLSGGQKQRVAICRALVRNPPVLFFDEATSALDNASESIVQLALEKSMEGRTSFTIAHRLSTIENSDIILVIGEGRVVESGTHDQLMDLDGVYTKLQAAQGNKKKKKDDSNKKQPAKIMVDGSETTIV